MVFTVQTALSRTAPNSVKTLSPSGGSGGHLNEQRYELLVQRTLYDSLGTSVNLLQNWQR